MNVLTGEQSDENQPKDDRKKGTMHKRPGGAGKAHAARSRRKATKHKGASQSKPRPGTKTAKILALLNKENGATLSEIMKVTAVDPRFLAGPLIKNRRLKIVSSQRADGQRTYSICH
jgi:hypothetical protein